MYRASATCDAHVFGKEHPGRAGARRGIGAEKLNVFLFISEEDFRKALADDPASFEALVNLGGALLSEGKMDQALAYNSQAVFSRPHDALANSQLGLTYFATGSLDLGQKYLEIARRIDPAHFSYPQLALAQIHLKRNERAAAAEEFHDFLRRHPDAPQAAWVRESLAKLEQ